MWTYVKEVEVVDATQSGPVVMAFKGQADDIREVVPLEQVSDEELARIEDDLLRGMEELL